MKILYNVVQNSLLKVYRPHGGLDFSHLFYADDCPLLAHATIKDAAYLAALIDVNCHYSCQIVNYEVFYSF